MHSVTETRYNETVFYRTNCTECSQSNNPFMIIIVLVQNRTAQLIKCNYIVEQFTQLINIVIFCNFKALYSTLCGG